jgi:cytochrome c551
MERAEAAEPRTRGAAARGGRSFRYLPGRMGYVIAFFVLCGVVGLVTLVIAFGGGRRRPLPGESRMAGRGIVLAVVVAFAFGLVVPVLVLYENGKHHASTADGIHLTAAEVTGREDFAEKCSICHTLKATNSVARIGPILDIIVPEEGTSFSARKSFVLGAIEEGRFEGNGNMPSKLFEGPEAVDVAAFVAAVAGHEGSK